MEDLATYDLIVIGGGAAGLMAAGTAAVAGRRVALLEKMEKTGRKVRISGKGRCNVTNMCETEEFFRNVRVNSEFLRPAFTQFTNRATVKFFERIGVKLKTEQGKRVFPASDKAWDIAQGMVNWCTDEGVTVICNACVTQIITIGERVLGVKYRNARGFERRLEAEKVIICTGGVSYPTTGSTGDGYRFAHATGHKIEEVRPSLVPLESSFPFFKDKKGFFLRNIDAKLYVDNTLRCQEFGEMSFSDRGLEGAVILRMSRDAVDALIEECEVKVIIDLKPALSEEQIFARIERERAELAEDAWFSELLRKLVPAPMLVPVSKLIDVNSKAYMSRVTDEQITRLVKLLKGLELPITDYRPFTEAVVTAGGVDVQDINPQTMESKLIKGLYFAGEVLDLDGNTGGYNLQIAFSTGRLAGQLL